MPTKQHRVLKQNVTLVFFLDFSDCIAKFTLQYALQQLKVLHPKHQTITLDMVINLKQFQGARLSFMNSSMH